MFVLFLHGCRADFKARVIVVLRLCMVNLLQGATLKGHLSCRLKNQSLS